MFEGVFFNGKSAKPILVNIDIRQDCLVLSMVEKSDPAITISFQALGIIQVFSGIILVNINTIDIPQSLEIKSSEFLTRLKEAYPSHPYFKDPHSFIFNKGNKAIAISIFLILGILAFFYFVIIPIAINNTTRLFPKKYEIELGQKLKSGYLEQVIIDSAKTNYINDFYSSLKRKTTYPIHITVVKSNVVNAFALPGGELVIYSGILDSMKNYSELIGLLGHETGHVEHQHTLKAIVKNLSNYLIVSILFQDYSGMMSVIIENASTVDQLAYSRHNETESDVYGYDMIIKNKGEPLDMATLFNRMLNEKEAYSDIPHFLMTHPKLEERIEVIRKRAANESYTFVNNELLRVKFQQARDGVQY